jgi:hypothetical protein
MNKNVCLESLPRTSDRRRRSLIGLLLLTVGIVSFFAAYFWGLQLKAAEPEPAEKPHQPSKLDLTPESFDKIRAAIRPTANEYRHLKVKWYTDIVAARKKAAQEDKPIVVFRTLGAGYNDPLGVC